jgi:hypothetical protein
MQVDQHEHRRQVIRLVLEDPLKVGRRVIVLLLVERQTRQA